VPKSIEDIGEEKRKGMGNAEELDDVEAGEGARLCSLQPRPRDPSEIYKIRKIIGIKFIRGTKALKRTSGRKGNRRESESEDQSPTTRRKRVQAAKSAHAAATNPDRSLLTMTE